MALTKPLSAPPVCARSTFTVSAPAALSAAASACGTAKAAHHHGERMVADNALQAGDEFAAFAEIDAVREPDDLDVRRGVEEALDQGQRLGAVDGVRLRLELLDLHARGAGDLQRNIARGFRQRQQRDAAIVGIGARDQFVGRAQPGVPGRGRAPSRRRA